MPLILSLILMQVNLAHARMLVPEVFDESSDSGGTLLTPDGVQADPAPAAPVPSPTDKPSPPRAAAAAKATPPTRTAPPGPTPRAAPAPAPRPPTLPACSSRTADVRAMLAKVMDTPIFDVVWREDRPMPMTKSGRFIVSDVGGGVRINMINGDGRSVGTAPARFCLRLEGGEPTLRVGLQRSSLKFGTKFGFIDLDNEVNEMLAKLANPNELPLIVTKGHEDGKIHIRDGVDGKQIDSDFTGSHR